MNVLDSEASGALDKGSARGNYADVSQGRQRECAPGALSLFSTSKSFEDVTN